MKTANNLTKFTDWNTLMQVYNENAERYNALIKERNDLAGQETKDYELRMILTYWGEYKTKTSLIEDINKIQDMCEMVEEKIAKRKAMVAYLSTDEGKAEKAELTKQLDELRTKYKSTKELCEKAILLSARTIIGDEWSLGARGLEIGYHTSLFTLEYMEDGKAKFAHEIECRYDSAYMFETNDERKFTFNVGTSGSFEFDETMAKRYIALGKLLQSKRVIDNIKGYMLEAELAYNNFDYRSEDIIKRLREMDMKD